MWLWNGGFATPPVDDEGRMPSESRLIQRDGWVKIISGRSGTSITWAVFARNWASLYLASEYLLACPGPFRFTYFLSGWFSESVENASAARERMERIIAKSDLHLQARTFVRETQADRKRMPETLRRALMERAVLPEFAVDVAFDEMSKTFQVGRVGVNSLIARYYGLNPVSYPCQTFHSYHHLVSRAYQRVLSTGEPHYDHVLAALQTPDALVRWFGYQRVVLPVRLPNGIKGVSVVADEAPVDIFII